MMVLRAVGRRAGGTGVIAPACCHEVYGVYYVRGECGVG